MIGREASEKFNFNDNDDCTDVFCVSARNICEVALEAILSRLFSNDDVGVVTSSFSETWNFGD